MPNSELTHPVRTGRESTPPEFVDPLPEPLPPGRAARGVVLLGLRRPAAASAAALARARGGPSREDAPETLLLDLGRGELALVGRHLVLEAPGLPGLVGARASSEALACSAPARAALARSSAAAAAFCLRSESTRRAETWSSRAVRPARSVVSRSIVAFCTSRTVSTMASRSANSWGWVLDRATSSWPKPCCW